MFTAYIKRGTFIGFQKLPERGVPLLNNDYRKHFHVNLSSLLFEMFHSDDARVRTILYRTPAEGLIKRIPAITGSSTRFITRTMQAS